MARQLLVDAVDHISTHRGGSLRLASVAHNGESGQGGWDTEDDAAAISFPGLKVVRLVEDASGSDKHIFRGRIWTKALGRGQWLLADGRRVAVAVVDSNWDFTKLRVTGQKRPAETDVARVLWVAAYALNGSSSTMSNARKRASTVIGTAYVPGTNLVTMPKRTYDSGDPFSVLDDCARAAGKLFFPILNDDGTLDLFYDLPTSTAYLSTLSISDDGSGSPDGPVYEPSIEAQAGNQDPSELISGAAIVDSTGKTTTAFDPAVEAAFDVAEVTQFDQGATPATVGDRLFALMGQHSIEEQRYRCFIEVPADQAHLLKAGMTIDYRHGAAGVTSPITTRVVRCEPELLLNGKYQLHLELNYPRRTSARIQNRGVIPTVVAGTAVVSSGASTTDYSITMRVFTTLGMDADLLVSFDDADQTARVHISLGDQGHPGTFTLQTLLPMVSGFQVIADDDAGWHTIELGLEGGFQFIAYDGAARVLSDGVTTSGTWYAPGIYKVQISNNGTPVGDPDGELRVDYIIGSAVIDDFNRGVAPGWDPGWDVVSGDPSTLFVDSAAGHIFNTVVQRFLDATEYAPLAGTGYTGHDFVWNFFADGASSSWTFPFAFVPGSLSLRVDGMDQNLVEDDPDTGDFHIGWTPAVGDQVRVVGRLPL